MKNVHQGYRFGVALFLAVVLVGCASTGPKLVAPKVTVIAAGLTSADVFSQQFRIRLHVDNPNARTLPIKSINYKLFLEGNSFAEGASEAAFVVPANGQKEFDLTVQTNFVSSIGKLLSQLTGTNRSTIAYTFAGDVVVDATFSPKLKFAESGMVDLARK